MGRVLTPYATVARSLLHDRPSMPFWAGFVTAVALLIHRGTDETSHPNSPWDAWRVQACGGLHADRERRLSACLACGDAGQQAFGREMGQVPYIHTAVCMYPSTYHDIVQYIHVHRWYAANPRAREQVFETGNRPPTSPKPKFPRVVPVLWQLTCVMNGI